MTIPTRVCTSRDPARFLICAIHGRQDGDGIICLKCYAKQQERVERESLPLRTANTATVLRQRVLTEFGKSNGRVVS